MTVLEAAKKLNANLADPCCRVMSGTGPSLKVCELAQLPITHDNMLSKRIEISQINGQYILDFTALVFLASDASHPKAGTFIQKQIFRVVTEPYAGLTEPVLAMAEVVF